MFFRLFLLFTLIPVVEIYLFVVIGGRIGAGPTIAVVLITGAVGAWLAREQGFQVLRRFQEEMNRGVPPGNALLEGALVLVGGVVLLTPGFLTDAIGLLLLMPPTRARIAAYVSKRVKAHIAVQQGVIDV